MSVHIIVGKLIEDSEIEGEDKKTVEKLCDEAIKMPNNSHWSLIAEELPELSVIEFASDTNEWSNCLIQLTPQILKQLSHLRKLAERRNKQLSFDFMEWLLQYAEKASKEYGKLAYLNISY